MKKLKKRSPWSKHQRFDKVEFILEFLRFHPSWFLQIYGGGGKWNYCVRTNQNSLIPCNPNAARAAIKYLKEDNSIELEKTSRNFYFKTDECIEKPPVLV